jgi:hypothetical protein
MGIAGPTGAPAATSLPAGPTTNCCTFLIDAPIADLKATAFSVSGTTAPKILGISRYGVLENVVSNGQ